MFTGIIEEVGAWRWRERADGWARARVTAGVVLDGLQRGDSVAVDGCCLTVTQLDDDAFEVDLMAETLQVTSLGALGDGARVNLERALAASGRFGGHIVQGHVDARGTVIERVDDPGTQWLRIECEPDVSALMVDKGSVTVSGVSLTIVEVAKDSFIVGIIPHTASATTLGMLQVGDGVNLELDIIGKYVARLLAAGTATPYRGMFTTSSSEGGA